MQLGRRHAIGFLCLVLLAGLTGGIFWGPQKFAWVAANEEDQSVIVKQLLQLSQHGSREAKVALAASYLRGDGVPQDYAKANELFMEAARQDEPNACYSLALIHASGLGTAADPNKAAAWFQRAAELGHVRSQIVTALNYATAKGSASNNVFAARWAFRAAQQGAVEAQIMLASMYRIGSGVPNDNLAAYAWATMAAANAKQMEQRDRAAQLIDRTRASMRPEEIIEAQSLAFAWRAQPEAVPTFSSVASSEQGGMQASLSFEENHAVVRWHLTRPLTAQLDLTADINGKPLDIRPSEPYPPPGTRTSVVLLLDGSDPARQIGIDADKTKIVEVAKKSDAQHDIDVASYADGFQLLQPRDGSIEALQAVLTQTAPRAEKANLNAALKSAIEMPSLYPAERLGIFVFHDGHTDDALDAKALIETARIRHTTFNFIISPSNRPIDPGFAALADATGGVVATNGQVVTESGPKPFLDAPFWPLDSGGTIRATVPRTPRFAWQSDPEVKFVFRVGTNDLVLKAAMPVPVLGVQDTIVSVATQRPLVTAGVSAAIFVLVGGMMFCIGRGSRKPADTPVSIHPTPSVPPQQTLAVLRNEEDGITYAVQSRIVQLGRASEAQIRLKDESVSRVHAILRQLKTGEFEIENCSSNGTFVNNEKVDVATLVDGDLVSLGRTTLRYAQRKLVDAGLGPAGVANAS